MKALVDGAGCLRSGSLGYGQESLFAVFLLLKLGRNGREGPCSLFPVAGQNISIGWLMRSRLFPDVDEGFCKGMLTQGRLSDLKAYLSCSSCREVFSLLEEAFPDVDWSKYDYPATERRVRRWLSMYGSPDFSAVVTAPRPVIALADWCHFSKVTCYRTSFYRYLPAICRVLGWNEASFREICRGHKVVHLKDTYSKKEYEDILEGVSHCIQRRSGVKPMAVDASGWHWTWRELPPDGFPVMADFSQGEGKLLKSVVRHGDRWRDKQRRDVDPPLCWTAHWQWL